ncbi:hypothetical protein LOAG_01005 [Loa loa]|uniref:Uncharacterized protein n=1 Tax=Loa loa TaxID=7209 RepID=A0A1I7VX06_LOALO|nr:hypothetical protein LOAG_01005 [Loa loa]EFO27474.1 hypothetical protein LOAG_01005 [Loa loa]
MGLQTLPADNNQSKDIRNIVRVSRIQQCYDNTIENTAVMTTITTGVGDSSPMTGFSSSDSSLMTGSMIGRFKKKTHHLPA